MVANLNVDEPTSKRKGMMESEISNEELILIGGGRPAFFAVKRMDPELASSTSSSPEAGESNYQQCKTLCNDLLRLLDSLTPELVTYSYMSQWADREVCLRRLETIVSAKEGLKSIISQAEEMFHVTGQVVHSLLGKLPVLVVDKVAEYMDEILDDYFRKFLVLHKTSELLKKVFVYLCECCFIEIPADQLSAQDMTPKKYCDCPNHFTTCSICGLPNAPCSLCATVKVIFQTLRALARCEELTLVSSYNQSVIQNELEGKPIRDQLVAACESGCECSDDSGHDDWEDQQYAELGLD